MVKSTIPIVWTQQAKESLKEIYDYYKKKSIQGAKNVKNDILRSPKTIHYSKQYQIDDINPKYRRIVVRDYKLLYREIGSTVTIIDIICTLQSPEILQEK